MYRLVRDKRGTRKRSPRGFSRLILAVVCPLKVWFKLLVSSKVMAGGSQYFPSSIIEGQVTCLVRPREVVRFEWNSHLR